LHTRRQQLQALGRYLVPKNNMWLRRACMLFGFILFDYFATLLFITTPIEEGNLLVRSFMETYGIFLGLTIFDILINLPIYLIICFNSHFVTLPSPISRRVDPFIDAALGWFVAGYHYSGGTSWFWAASDLTRQTTGFIIYLAVAIIVYQAPKFQQLFLSLKQLHLFDET